MSPLCRWVLAGVLLSCALAALPERSRAQTAPAKPTGLTTEDGNTQVRLRWTGPNDSTITAWQYSVKTTGNYGAWMDIPGSGPATRRYTVVGLTNNRTYKFRIRAVNDAGPGRASDERTGEPYAKAPEKPAGFRADPGDRKALLSWNGADDVSIQGWEYRRKESGGSYGSWTAMSGSGANTVKHTVGSLENGTEYIFRIRAFNNAGNGYVSDERSVTPVPSVPDMPTGFSVESGNRRAILTWDDPKNDTIRKWQYTYKTTGDYGAWIDMAGSGAATVRHIVSMLENGTVYTFRIRAVNDVGNGVESDESPAKPMATAPEKPAGLTALAGDRRITLSWTDPSDASISKWQYAYGTGGDFGEWIDIPGSGAATTAYTVTGLVNGTTYIFKLRAVNDAGAGPESDQASSTPLSVPAKPSGFTVTAGDALAVLGWDNALNTTITGWQYSFKTSGNYGAWTGVPGSGAATTGHTVAGLANGVDHVFRIRAVNASGNGAESDAVAATPRPVPAKPAGFRTEAGNTQARLLWTDPGNSSITGWQYSVKTAGSYGAWTDIPDSGAATVRYTVTGLANDTVHTFRIRALNGSGAGPQSDEASTTPQFAAPAKPTGFGVESGDGQVVLTWNDPDDSSISGWEYNYKTSDGDYSGHWFYVPGSGARTTRHTVTGLVNGTEYTFKIRAANNVNGHESDERTATPQPPRPAKPTGLSATAGDGRAALAWDDPSNATISKWQYAYKTDSGYGGWTDVPDSAATTTAHTVTGLANGVAHTFRIRAVNGGGGSAASDEATVTPIPVPAKPAGFAAAAGDGQVSLSWTDPGDSTITGWQYSYKTTGGYGNWTKIPGSTATTTGHIVTGLTNGTAHTFRLRAVNASGNGAESDEAAATPLAAPAKPAGLVAAAGAGEVVLSWDNPNDAAITGWEYNQRRAGGQFEENWSFILGSGAATTSYTVPGLEIGATYGFKVRAVIDGFEGAESDEATVTLPPVPAKPAGLEATAGDRRVSLQWTALGDSTVTGWQYRYRTEGSGYGSWTDVPNSSGNTTGHTVTGLAPGVLHSFRIKAANSSGPGLESDEAVATPFAVPAKPTGLTATPGSAEALLEWDDPEDPEIDGWEYNQRRSDEDYEEEWTPIQGSGPATTSHIVIGLEVDAYGFKVRAVADGRAGPESDEANVRLVPGLPAAPENLRADPGDRQAELLWDDPGNPGITGWQYRYRTIGDFGPWTDIPDGEASLTTHTVTGLANEVAHDFQLRARTEAGFGPPSETATAVPLSLKPGRPTGLKAHAGYGQVVLTWDDPENPDIVRWQYLREGPGMCGQESPGWIDAVEAPATRYTVKGLEGGVEYCFQIRACTGEDRLNPICSDQSNVAFATPKEAAKPAERRTVRTVLAVLAGHVAAGANAMIGARFSADPAVSRFVLAGREVPLFAHGGEERMQAPPGGVSKATVQGISGRDLLRDSSFQVALGPPGEEGFQRWSLWHRGDLKRFEGSAGPQSRYGGRLLSAWFGVDMQLGRRWLLGAALGRSEGKVDYGAGAASGALKTALDSVHPYLQRRFEDGGTAWITLGSGRGTIENETAGRDIETADTELATASAGFRTPLPAFRGLKLSASGAAGLARLEADGDARTAIGSLSASTNRQRFGVEAALEEGDVAYHASLSLRRDGGDGASGIGLELAQGVEAALPSLPGHAAIRTWGLVRNSDGEYRELGVTAAIRRPAEPNARGLSWSLSVAQGTRDGAAGGPEAFWSEDTPKRSGGENPFSLHLSAGWGFVSRGSAFTPRAAFGLAEASERRFALGIDMGPLSGPRLKLGAERRIPHTGTPESRITAVLHFRF